MVSVVRFKRIVADSILSYSTHAYPKEGILLLRGKTEKDEILITEVLIPPLATHGRGFSGFSSFMLPMDLSVIGISHSHPSGALRPSIHDLNHFYGKIMVIAAYPYESYSNIGVFNSHGNKLPHEVLPDSQHSGSEMTNEW